MQSTNVFSVFTFDLIFPSATTQNNLETSDVSKSEHFRIAASLLEVGFIFTLYIFFTWHCKKKRRNKHDHCCSTLNHVEEVLVCVFCVGPEILPGYDVDPPFLYDQQRESDQTPQRRAGL